MKIENRTFAISGGASGLGRACALDLVAHGALVAIFDFDTDAGAAFAAELGRDKARFFECDVTDSKSIAAGVKGLAQWVQATAMPLGGIIPAAGVGLPGLIIDRHRSPLDLSAITAVININLIGTLDFIRQLLPLLLAAPPTGPDNERGAIVSIASSAAFDGQRGQVAYAASKGGVAALTLPLARDLAQWGVRAVAIAPSLFETGMTKNMGGKTRESLMRAMEFPKRPGKAGEFALLVRHVLENSMLNGEVIRLDGAMRMPSKL
ncbi:hypothetical protein TD95_002175 [Thielaviopsis punctulata]|uniref:3-hydroxyacyl-CoA dehydrogenase type-2 n=1 Tax=Thielaviopsis punctulata TaxID=72032 RepID=A0A0F4ZEL5_9PEZI|nr:hypothetical protein TD95_002175 [Thielaviopsis punctulata]